MSSFKGHFDGTAIVLDEPATLAVGQVVRVIVDPWVAVTRFADRVVLPEFANLPSLSGDTTRQISADRDGAHGTGA